MKALLSHTLIRFAIAGCLNTIFGLIVYSALALTPLPTWAVLMLSNLLGMIFNFMTTGGMVFRDLGLRRVPRFVICYGVLFLIYWVLINSLSQVIWGLIGTMPLIDRLSPTTGGRIGAMAVIVVPMTLLTYLLQSRYVFAAPGGPRAGADEADETFKPFAVRPPPANPLGFALRCLVDLQLGTIATPLRPALAAMPPGEILDVGAGRSPWRDWLPADCLYVGLDIQNAGDFGMPPPSSDIHYYDGHLMPFADASFDGAFCIEVLEHAADPDELLREAARVLKPGAVLLLTTPWSARRHHIPYDFHRFTRERLAIMLATHGFKDVAVQERGDDIDAIATKLIVLTLGSLQRMTLINAVLMLPLSILFALMSAVMLCVAHLPRSWGLASNADPLGYFCRAVRS